MDASQRSECLPHTQEDALLYITDWLSNPLSDKNILWFYGVAGCGKSTIANTIASASRDRGRLGAFLSFDQSVTSKPSHFVRTLAYQLGSFDPIIGAEISTVISRNPRVAELPLPLQFRNIILGPLNSLNDRPGLDPIVAVIDGLDECGDSDTRKVLLEIFANGFGVLPKILRFFITSCPQHDIATALANHGHISIREFYDSGCTNPRDIAAFVHKRLGYIRIKNNLIDPLLWPDHAQVGFIIEQSAGLFAWCSAAMMFVEKGQDPAERLELLLHKTVLPAVDDLYAAALQVSGFWDDRRFVGDFRSILGAIVVAKYPLSPDTIDRLLEYNRSETIIKRLSCVLTCLFHHLHSHFASVVRRLSI